jgi:hypothetical protein
VKKLLTAGFIAAGLMSFVPMSAAHADCVKSGPPLTVTTGPCSDGADSTGAIGFTCGFASSDDPSGAIANPGTQVGEVNGGPVLVVDLPGVDSTTTPPTITYDTTGNVNPSTLAIVSAKITCGLQVGGTGVYSDPDAVTASASGPVLVNLPPTLVSYQATATDPVWSCTTWTLTDANGASVTLYADAAGGFSTDPTTAKCALATSQDTDPCVLIPVPVPICPLPPVVKP